MPTYTFPKVERYAEKSTKCIGCGKRLRRRTTLWQTLSPFNKSAAGELKTSEEIYAELGVELEQWKSAPEWCAPCGDELRVRADQLAIGDVLVRDDSSRLPVTALDARTRGQHSLDVVVNPGDGELVMSDLVWVTRFPAGHPALTA